MNKYLLFIFKTVYLFIIPGLLLAQIPNNGFEEWQDGDPVGWNTFDMLWDAVSQSNDAHSGSNAAKLEIVEFWGEGMPPYMNITFPIAQNYNSLQGYYKFMPISEGDALNITFLFFKSQLFDAVASGSITITEPAPSYTQFSIPIIWLSEKTGPDSAYIAISIESEPCVPGSYALIDDLSFSFEHGTAVEPEEELPLSFVLRQNYPNPFNPSTVISYQLQSAGFVTLKVYDVLGNETAVLVNEYQQPGSYNCQFSVNNNYLSSGVYFYKLTTGNFSETKKMLLMK